MKLRSIEAVDYGSLQNVSVDGIGDGLTVVLGPNESGKSTFTSLTRHVLYGYPTQGKDGAYVPASLRRHARLVFGNDEGEWALERTEGPRGGQLNIINRQGAAAPLLRDDLVGGVTQETFHVVFGFGLDDLAAIASKGNQQIESLLYAADTGLNVSPIKVADELKARADALYAPRASKPVVNTLAAEMKASKAKIKALEEESSRNAVGEKRAAEMAEALAPLKERRDELDMRTRSLATAVERVRSAVQKRESLGLELEKLRREIAALQRDLEMVQVDERVLAQGGLLDGVLAELPVYRERLEKIAAAESAANDIARQIQAMNPALDLVQDTPERRAYVQRWVEQKAKLENAAEAGRREAAQKRIYAEETAKSVSTGQTDRPSLIPPLVFIGLGILAAMGGFVLSQTILFGLAVGLIVAGAAWLFRPKQQIADTSSIEAKRARTDFEAATRVSEDAGNALEQARSEWRGWLAQQHLDAYGDDPVSVTGLLDEARKRAELQTQRDSRVAEASRERDAAEAWAVRLVDAVAPFDSAAGQLPELNAALELAARGKAAVEAARRGDQERKKFSASLEGLAGTEAVLKAQIDECTSIIVTTALEFGFCEAGALEALESTRQSVNEELREAKQECEALAGQLATLRGELGSQGLENELAIEAQKYEGYRAKAAAEADSHLIYALAARLVNQARERYERERQPEVVKAARRIYSEMTDGRYSEIRMPWDGNGGITVASANKAERPVSALSTGAAQQLYLALRAGTIAAHGDRGKWLPVLMDDVVVNFDPERREGAAKAIAELAAMRQVIFFTCHPDTAALLTSVVPDATLVKLDRCPF